MWKLFLSAEPRVASLAWWYIGLCQLFVCVSGCETLQSVVCWHLSSSRSPSVSLLLERHNKPFISNMSCRRRGKNLWHTKLLVPQCRNHSRLNTFFLALRSLSIVKNALSSILQKMRTKHKSTNCWGDSAGRSRTIAQHSTGSMIWYDSRKCLSKRESSAGNL